MNELENSFFKERVNVKTKYWYFGLYSFLLVICFVPMIWIKEFNDYIILLGLIFLAFIIGWYIEKKI